MLTRSALVAAVSVAALSVSVLPAAAAAPRPASATDHSSAARGLAVRSVEPGAVGIPGRPRRGAVLIAVARLRPKPAPKPVPKPTPKPVPKPVPAPSKGTLIVAEARRYLGVPYVHNGATPAGFDCSGYTAWVYRYAGAGTLPHLAEGQRRLFRTIPRAQARPGDLIFYLSGGSAYHVAIYIGDGKQYAAPAPGQNVKVENIWSSAVTFGTNWH